MSLRNKIKSILRESFVNEQEDENPTLYKALRMWIRGKISERELEGSDDMIYEVKYRRGHPGEASIIFDLDNDSKFFELLDISEDDGYFARAVTDRHSSGWDFNDSDTIEEDFKEGYIVFGDLDVDNSEKIQEIVFLLTGEKFDVNASNEVVGKFAKLLVNTFPDEMDYIISEYSIERDIEMNKTAKDSIESELNEFMKNIGFNISREFDLISTTPANLIMWYSKLGEKNLTFEELFEQIIGETNTSRLGGWMDMQYEFRDDNNFDSSSFNRAASNQLDKILDKINEDSGDFESYKKMVKEVTDKYNVNMWYFLPKDSKYEFLVESFNKDNLSIKVMVRQTGSWKTKPIMMTLDTFNRFLYQPELFSLSDLIPESINEYFDPLHFLKKKFSKKDDREIGGGLERVHQFGDDFQKVVDLIFKKAIKENPIEHLKGLKVTSVYPQQTVNSDGIPNSIRWNINMIPVVPDWFNYQKNLGFIHNTRQFEQIFRDYARYMGIESTPPASVKGNPNYVENPDELNNYISFNLVVKKFETF